MAVSFKTLNTFWGRAILTGAFLLLALPLYALADSDSTALTDADAAKVVKLESKFFEHSYAKEDVEGRLTRLEKLVFGQPSTGTPSQRLTALWQAVPNIDSGSTASDSTATQAEAGGSKAPKKASGGDRSQATEVGAAPDESSDYPAVTAMEKKVLGKTYANDEITARLDRLEGKVFGKPSASSDLSDRVDQLKQRTGVDIARLAPSGSDWADEEDDGSMPMPPPSPKSSQLPSKPGEDGRSFSGRDMRADMQKAFGGMPSSKSYGGSSGAYGMDSYGTNTSNLGGSASGSYGFGGSSSSAGLVDPDSESLPPTAPDRNSLSQTANPQPTGMGLNQEVSALEGEIFGKSYAHDPLPARVTRLETTVFPQKKPAVDAPLPARVQSLLAAVPISNSKMSLKSKHNNSVDPDDDNIDDGQNASSQTKQGHRGLSKIISSMGNLLGGGMMGGYPMQSGTLVTDPRTGLIIDQYTGNVIDPNTGAVVGTRQVSPYGAGGYSTGYGTGMGTGFGGYGSPFGSFGNGFSPFGSPYGMGSGMGSGMRFGFGGGRMGGMWP